MTAVFTPRRLCSLAVALLLALLAAQFILGLRLLAAGPEGQWGIDFGAYYNAAAQIGAGELPYTEAQLTMPFDAQGEGPYRYPPPLAVWLIPLTVLPENIAATIWFATQLAAMLGALLYVTSRAGVTRQRDRILISTLALAAFIPVFDALHKGNISGFVMAATALAMFAAPAIAAGGATILALTKLAPGALLLPLLAFHPLTTLRGAALAGAVFVLPSLLVPSAWSAYLTVLPNMLAGSSDYPNNLAVGHQLSTFLPQALARDAGWILAAGFAAAALVASRSGRFAAAIVAAVMLMLLLPAVLWWHYSVVLLPALLYVLLTRHDVRIRAVLLATAALVAMNFNPLLASLAIVLLGVLLTVTLWDRREVAHA